MRSCRLHIGGLSIMESKYSQARIAAPSVWPYEGSNPVRLAEIFRPTQWRYPLHHAAVRACEYLLSIMLNLLILYTYSRSCRLIICMRIYLQFLLNLRHGVLNWFPHSLYIGVLRGNVHIVTEILRVSLLIFSQSNVDKIDSNNSKIFPNCIFMA